MIAEVEALDWERSGVRPVGVRWESRRSDSIIAAVDVSDGTSQREVIFKQHTREADASRPPAVRARHEYDILSRLERVPRVLLLDETHGALLMERASGTPLDELIRGAKRERDVVARLEPAIRLAGQWLRDMQRQTRVARDGTSILTEVMNAVIGTAPKKIANRMRELAAKITQRPLPVAGHHGDYWPGNIFIDGDRVEVIDFEGFREGLALEDVAYFLIELELLFPRARRAVAPLRNAFLDAYAAGDPIDQDALQLFTLTKALHLLARDPGAQQPWLIRTWIRWTLRRCMERCLR